MGKLASMFFNRTSDVIGLGPNPKARRPKGNFPGPTQPQILVSAQKQPVEEPKKYKFEFTFMYYVQKFTLKPEPDTNIVSPTRLEPEKSRPITSLNGTGEKFSKTKTILKFDPSFVYYSLNAKYFVSTNHFTLFLRSFQAACASLLLFCYEVPSMQ